MKFIQLPDFPNSRIKPFLITSPHTSTYNCIAWAYGDSTRWYWPDPENIYYWPKNIPREINIPSFIKLYEAIGYKNCDNGEYIEEYEKVAIFADENGIPTHAARQLDNGDWTSKLGQSIDVQHTIKAIEEGAYGVVSVYMKREKE